MCLLREASSQSNQPQLVTMSISLLGVYRIFSTYGLSSIHFAGFRVIAKCHVLLLIETYIRTVIDIV